MNIHEQTVYRNLKRAEQLNYKATQQHFISFPCFSIKINTGNLAEKKSFYLLAGGSCKVPWNPLSV